MDYEAKIPLGEELVGKDLSKFLQGMAVTVPIRGTASHPEIDRKAAKQQVSASQQKSGQKTVEQEVLDLLEGVLPAESEAQEETQEKKKKKKKKRKKKKKKKE
jgi:hypothetical protein